MAIDLDKGAERLQRAVRSGWALPVVLLIAAAMRLTGITWGLPSSAHFFSYHPDESRVLQVILGLDPLHGAYLPHFYNYPTLQISLVSIMATAAYVFGPLKLPITDLATGYPQFATIILLGRCLTAAMGVGTVWATYAVGRRLMGRGCGILGALFLAISPLHAQHSHWLTVDVPATFWTMLAMVWAARLATGDPKPLRAACLGGLFAGLAAATKYNCVLALLPVAGAALLTMRPHRDRPALPSVPPAKAIGMAAAAVVLTLCAFLAGCPGSILENAKFLEDVHTEALHVSQQGGDDFAGTGSGFVYQIATNLHYGLGPLLLLLCVPAVALAFQRRSRLDAVLLLFVIPYYVLISLPQVRYARYCIPLLPPLCIWVGAGFATGWHLDGGKINHRILNAGLALCGFLSTLSACQAIVGPMADIDPRDRALAAVQKAGLAGPTGFATMPWFQTAPLDPLFSHPLRGAWQQASLSRTTVCAPYLYNGADWDRSVLDARPPVIVIGDYDYRNAIRLHQASGAAWLGRLKTEYRPLAVFGGDGQPEMTANPLPLDMMYSNPKTWVWVRK